MKIDYSKILKKNLINVLRDVLTEIQKNNINFSHQLFITFKTNDQKVLLPKWLLKKHPEEMTIVIQYEFWDLKVFKEKFEIVLSFNDIKTNLSIPFQTIISFADPYANFGLKIESEKKVKKRKQKNTTNKIIIKKNNVIDFKKYKKLK